MAKKANTPQARIQMLKDQKKSLQDCKESILRAAMVYREVGITDKRTRNAFVTILGEGAMREAFIPFDIERVEQMLADESDNE